METQQVSLYDSRLAPAPKWEYYTAAEIQSHKQNGYTLAVIDYSYDQFIKAHCVLIDAYNDTIDDWASAEDELL